MARLIPTAPGWWWASWHGMGPVAVRVFGDTHGGLGLVAVPSTPRGRIPIADSSWTWLAPIPTPERIAEMEAAEARAHRLQLEVWCLLGEERHPVMRSPLPWSAVGWERAGGWWALGEMTAHTLMDIEACHAELGLPPLDLESPDAHARREHRKYGAPLYVGSREVSGG